MIQAIAKKSFLLRQEEIGGGKRKDINTVRGEKIQVSEREAIRFFGGLEISETDTKKLVRISKDQGIKRVI